MNKQVLVASIFAGGKGDTEWCKIQSSFLDKTSSDSSLTKLAVVANDCEDLSLYKKYGYIVLKQDSNTHRPGIVAALDYFQNQTNLPYFCLLDSDAWPIDSKWVDLCIEWSNYVTNTNVPKIGVAAFRPENLDFFPHPCIFFIKREFINKPRSFYKTEIPNRNVLGDDFVDTFSELKSDWFYPLLRSNKVNLHPIVGGIYSNIFYHHGAGSRGSRFRAFASNFYTHYIHKFPHKKRLTQELFANPEEFINKLKY
jgi:hypothetical protein